MKIPLTFTLHHLCCILTPTTISSIFSHGLPYSQHPKKCIDESSVLFHHFDIEYVSLLLPRGQWLAWMPSEPCKSYQELTLKPLHTVLSCPIKKLSFWTSVFWSFDLFSQRMKRHRMRKLAVIITTEVFIKCQILSVETILSSHTHSPTHNSIWMIMMLNVLRCQLTY